MAINALSVVPASPGLTLLEQLHANTSKKCERKGGTAPLLMGVNRKDKTAFYVQADCKMWDCKVCGSRKASQWIARIIEGIKDYGGDWYFATITSHEKWRGQDASLKNLRQGWRKLYNRLLRRFGKFHYIKIFEHHADTSLHLHVLTDLTLPYQSSQKVSKKTGQPIDVFRCKLLKDLSRKCGMGYQCDYQPIVSAGLAVWYVVKYLSKSIGNADFPANVRRIQASHKWKKLPKLYASSELVWMYVTSHTDMLLKAYNLWIREGIVVYDMIADKEITTDDFEPVLRGIN